MAGLLAPSVHAGAATFDVAQRAIIFAGKVQWGSDSRLDTLRSLNVTMGERQRSSSADSAVVRGSCVV